MQTTRRTFMAVAGAAAAGLASFTGPALARSRGPWPPTPIVVHSRVIERFAIGSDLARFGPLQFLGGLELSCRDDRFGGFSGLSWLGPERFLSVSDTGVWLTGTVQTEAGQLAGLSDTVLAPMLDEAGRPMGDTRRFDTECVCVADGVAWVGIERVHEVMRFPVGKDGLLARGVSVPVPAAVKSLPSNKSLEAIAVVPAGPLAGSVITIAERARTGEDTPTQGWFVTGPQRGATFDVARRDGFDVTDCAFLPGGDLLILERHFTWLTGVAIRIRRIPQVLLRPGATLDGPVLITADMRYQIDNMEGLAVSRDRDGGVLLTLVSDDNFSALQRTLMLRFRLLEG